MAGDSVCVAIIKTIMELSHSAEISEFNPNLEIDATYFKHIRGKPLNSSQKKIILNMFTKQCELYPTKTVKEVTKDVSETTGISERSVFLIRAEFSQTGKVTTPKRKRPRPDIFDKCDDFDKGVIRRKVHNFFLRNEIPTLNKVLQSLNADDDLPKFTRSSLYRLLRKLGFVYSNRTRKAALIERDDIVLWRRKYLREIKKIRKSGQKIYYTDETWINAGHTVSKVWTDTTVKSAKQAFRDGLTSGLKNPSGKGKRLIVVHIGSDTGFVEDAELLFESKLQSDYHEEMNGTVYLEWIKTVLPKLEPNSVIVMDNAKYHSVKSEKVPTTAWRKQDIQSWLRDRKIVYTSDMLKIELLQLVKSIKEKHERYVIDEMVKLHGHTILRLPPYHCQLNPIEMIWSQIKRYVARENKTFKLPDVKVLTKVGISQVTAENWNKYVQHVIKEEDAFWRIDELQEEVVQQLIINVGQDADSESSHTDTTCDICLSDDNDS